MLEAFKPRKKKQTEHATVELLVRTLANHDNCSDDLRDVSSLTSRCAIDTALPCACPILARKPSTFFWTPPSWT